MKKFLPYLFSAAVLATGCNNENNKPGTTENIETDVASITPQNKVSDLVKAGLKGNIKKQVSFYYDRVLSRDSVVQPENPSEYEKVTINYDELGNISYLHRSVTGSATKDQSYGQTTYEYKDGIVTRGIIKLFGKDRLIISYNHTDPLAYSATWTMISDAADTANVLRQNYTLNKDYKIETVTTTYLNAEGEDSVEIKQDPGQISYQYMEPYISFKEVASIAESTRVYKSDSVGNPATLVIKRPNTGDILVETFYEYR
jgi:hypothetical protein